MTSNAGRPSISAALEQRYAVLGELGRGTFGRVYKARQISTGQDIALKILASSPGDLDGERRRQRFRREMQLCSVLSHPHIVRLIDAGDEGGLLYAAFEFLPGPTLREVLESEGRLCRYGCVINRSGGCWRPSRPRNQCGAQWTARRY